MELIACGSQFAAAYRKFSLTLFRFSTFTRIYMLTEQDSTGQDESVGNYCDGRGELWDFCLKIRRWELRNGRE